MRTSWYSYVWACRESNFFEQLSLRYFCVVVFSLWVVYTKPLYFISSHALLYSEQSKENHSYTSFAISHISAEIPWKFLQTPSSPRYHLRLNPFLIRHHNISSFPESQVSAPIVIACTTILSYNFLFALKLALLTILMFLETAKVFSPLPTLILTSSRRTQSHLNKLPQYLTQLKLLLIPPLNN